MNKSILRILRNKNINRPKAILKYIIWQLVKALNLFPRSLKVSNSEILIPDYNSANEGGGLMFTHGLYDFNNMSLLLMLSNSKKWTFFDIGANKGVYSLLASESSLTDVYTFEPHPTTFDELKNNIKLNNRSVNLFNIALGSKIGKVNFSDKPGSSINKVIDDELTELQVIEVPMTTLDQFSKENNVRGDYLKIDVEGFEFELLNGASIALEKVIVLQIEINENYDKVLNVLGLNSFSGPFYYNHSKKVFYSEKFIGCEDPIFIKSHFLSDFTQEYKIQIK